MSELMSSDEKNDLLGNLEADLQFLRDLADLHPSRELSLAITNMEAVIHRVRDAPVGE